MEEHTASERVRGVLGGLIQGAMAVTDVLGHRALSILGSGESRSSSTEVLPLRPAPLVTEVELPTGREIRWEEGPRRIPASDDDERWRELVQESLQSALESGEIETEWDYGLRVMTSDEGILFTYHPGCLTLDSGGIVVILPWVSLNFADTSDGAALASRILEALRSGDSGLRAALLVEGRLLDTEVEQAPWIAYFGDGREPLVLSQETALHPPLSLFQADEDSLELPDTSHQRELHISFLGEDLDSSYIGLRDRLSAVLTGEILGS